MAEFTAVPISCWTSPVAAIPHHPLASPTDGTTARLGGWDPVVLFSVTVLMSTQPRHAVGTQHRYMEVGLTLSSLSSDVPVPFDSFGALADSFSKTHSAPVNTERGL